MDESSLIDFNNEDCHKISSPLIPAPKFTAPRCLPRLSDIDNNPFDKVLRTIVNKDDPFECNTNKSLNNNIANDRRDTKNKENIGHLVSFIETPVKSKRYKKLSMSPLYITKIFEEDVNDISSNQFPVISKLHNLSLEFNTADTSLQILSDSVLNNNDDFDLSTSFNVACNLPLPNLPDDDISNSWTNKVHLDITTVIQDESKNLTDNTNCSPSNALNNAFVDNLTFENLQTRLCTRSSVDSRGSFNINSFNLGISEISSVIPSVSSMASKDSESDNQLDKAFLNDSSQVRTFEPGKCLSARKCSNNFMSIASTSKATKLNNSFAGFNYVDRKFSLLDNYDDDSVFLEAAQLAEVFRSSAASLDLDDEDISQCSPPWVEDEVVFVDDEDEKINESIDIAELSRHNKISILETETVQDDYKCDNAETIANNNNDADMNNKLELNIIVTPNKESDKTDNTEVKNAKDLLHNLTAILNSSGTVVDQRKLGENLLNSLALALNIENPVTRNSKEDFNKLQRSKSDSRVSEKSRAFVAKQEHRLTVPKLKTQSVAPVKLDKNLKLKNEKEKVTTRGPLKALIPLTNMAKNKKSVAPKVILTNTTPPKQSLQNSFQIKKTSTPNGPKIKPPIAQSTPDVTKMQGTDLKNGTPISKRIFGFSISPLSRPASTGDISNVTLNNSLSPKNTSGSVPNLNKSGSNLSKIPSNTSIPTMKSLNRRNSTSDMSTSRSNTLNRSYENKQPVRPINQLKRSSSFQNKSTTTTQKINSVDNNNTMKKYGIPGTLKSLKLVPKFKKSTDK